MTRSSPGATTGSTIGVSTALSVVETTVPVSSTIWETRLPMVISCVTRRSSMVCRVRSVRSSTASEAAMSRADASSTCPSER